MSHEAAPAPSSISTRAETPSILPLKDAPVSPRTTAEDGRRKSGKDRTPQQELFRKQGKEPGTVGREMQRIEPGETQEVTKDICSDVLVAEFAAVHEVLEQGGVVAPWQQELADILEMEYKRVYSATGLGSASAEVQKNLMVKLMHEKPEQFAAFSIKIAESQQEALQVATGAHMKLGGRDNGAPYGFGAGLANFGKRNFDAEKMEYVPEGVSIGPQGMEQATRRHDRGGAMSRFIRRHDGTGQRQGSYFTENDWLYAHAGHRRVHVVAGVDFPEGARFNPDQKLNSAAGQRALSEVQKAYLRNMKVLGKVVPNEAIELYQQNEVRQAMEKLVFARMDTYRSFGRQTFFRDFNVVQVDVANGFGRRLTGMRESSAGDRQINMANEGMDVAMHVGREASQADYETLLLEMTKTLKADVSEKLKRKYQETGLTHGVQDQIEQIAEKMKPQELSDAEKAERKTKMEAAAKLKAEVAEIETFKGLVEAINEKTARKTELEVAHAAGITAEAALRTARTTKSGIENEINKKKIELQHAKEGVKQREDAIKVVQDQINTLGRARQTVPAALTARLAPLNADLTAFTANVTTFSNEIVNFEKDLYDANQEIATQQAIVDANQAGLAELKQVDAEITTLTKRAEKLRDTFIAAGAPGAGLPVTDAAVATALETAIAIKKTEIETNEADVKVLDKKSQPDRFLMRQHEAMSTFKDLVLPANRYDAIQLRARERSNITSAQQSLDLAARIYPGYSPAYLRVIQVMFSDSALQNTKDGRELFRKASAVFSYDEFQAYTRGRSVSRGDVNQDFITGLVDELSNRALRGEIGQTSPAEQASIEAYEKIVPADIRAERKAMAEDVTNARHAHGGEVLKTALTGSAAAGREADFYKDYLSALRQGRNTAAITAELNATFGTVFTDVEIEAMKTDVEAANKKEITIESFANLVELDRPRFAVEMFRQQISILFAGTPDAGVSDDINTALAAGRPLGEIVERYRGEPRLYFMLNQARELALEPSLLLTGALNFVVDSPDSAARQEIMNHLEANITHRGSVFDVLQSIPATNPLRTEVLDFWQDSINEIVPYIAAGGALPAFAIDMRLATQLRSETRRNTMLGLGAPGAAPSELTQEVFRIAEHINTKQAFEQQIQNYDLQIPFYESVADLARRISAINPVLPQDIARMAAEEINKNRARRGLPVSRVSTA